MANPQGQQPGNAKPQQQQAKSTEHKTEHKSGGDKATKPSSDKSKHDAGKKM
jgi:hypothetical protein